MNIILQSTQLVCMLAIFGAKCIVTSLYVVRTLPYDVMATMSAFWLLSQTLKFASSILILFYTKKVPIVLKQQTSGSWKKRKEGIVRRSIILNMILAMPMGRF